MKAPLVIMDGNCQGQHMASVITATRIADCYVIGGDLGFLPSHLGLPCRYVNEQEAHNLVVAAREAGRWAIQATQSTPMSDGATLSYTGLVDQIIRYPHLQFYATSPVEAKTRFGSRATPCRVLDMDYDIIDACQKRAGMEFDLCGYIREEGTRRPLFHTALHPHGAVMSKVFRFIASQIPGVEPYTVAAAERFLERSEGMNFATSHPVTVELLKELGFDWGTNYELYRDLLVLRAAGSWSEIVNRQSEYIEAFWDDTWCWLSLTQANIAIGKKHDAELCLRRLIELSPGYIHVWLIGVGLYRRFEDADGIDALMHRARSFFAGQRIQSQVMAYVYLNLGRPREAEAHARDYYRRTPDRADALILLLTVLDQLGFAQEVSDTIAWEFSVATPARKAEIRAQFEVTPELAHLLPA